MSVFSLSESPLDRAERTSWLQHVLQYDVSVLSQVFEFFYRLVLNLPDTLPRESDLRADAVKRERIRAIQTISQLYYLALSARQM
jgi:hypothetical protein